MPYASNTQVTTTGDQAMMTAQQLVDEMQRLIVQHPEAANLPVQFEGCYATEDGDGNYPVYTLEDKAISRVVLDLRNKCFTVDGA